VNAGRTLDALVAEKVVGWIDITGEWGYVMGNGLQRRIPHYSTRIEDAWKVVDLLHPHGIVCITNGDGDSFDADFMPFIPAPFLGKYWPASAGGSSCPTESWPHAICLMALKAVGEEVS
jgi:hypothetical protein